MNWVVLLLVLPILPQAQEPTKICQALVESLEQKFIQLDPFTVELRFESQSGAGPRKLRATVRVHFRLAEHWFHMTTREHQEDGSWKETFAFTDNVGAMMIWENGRAGVAMDETHFLMRRLLGDFEVGSFVNRFFGSPRKHSDEQAFRRDLRSVFNVHFESSGDPAQPWRFRVAMGLGTGDRASWLGELLRVPDGDMVEAKESVTVTSASPSRKVVIDRTSGFLREIRAEIPGESAYLTVTRVSRDPVKPAVLLPEKMERKRAPLDSTPARLAAEMAGELPLLVARLYREWGTAGAPGRAESLEDMIAGLAVRYETLRRETANRKVAANLVKSARSRGMKLEAIEEEFEKAVAAFEKDIKILEEREREGLLRITVDFRDALLKSAAGTPGPEGAAKLLAQRIQEALETDRLDRARAGVRVPDAAALLREEIASQYAEDVAPARYVLLLRAEQARALQMRVAELGPFSLRLVLENVDSANLKFTEHEVDVHFSPEARTGLVRFYAPEGDTRKLRQTLLLEESGTLLTWGPGEPGLRLDQRPSWERSMRMVWNWSAAAARLNGPPARVATFEDFKNECRPYLWLDAKSTNSPALKSSLRVLMVLSPAGGTSWLDELRRSVVVEHPEDGVLRFMKGRRTVEVDLKTGLPRSIRTEFPGGAQATMKVVDVRPGVARPEVALPEKIATRITPPESQAGNTFEFLDERLQRETLAILSRWDRFESEEGSGSLRTFYAAAASIMAECLRDRAWLSLAIQYVKAQVAKGHSLDLLEEKLDDAVTFFEKAATSQEEAMEIRISRELSKVKTHLVEGVGPFAGPRVVRKRFEALLDESFRPESGTEPADPDFRTLLKAAIEDAKANEDKGGQPAK